MNLRPSVPKTDALDQAALHPVHAPGGTRTHIKKQILSLPCLPIAPQERVLVLLVRFELTQRTTFEVAASSDWATGAKIDYFPTN